MTIELSLLKVDDPRRTMRWATTSLHHPARLADFSLSPIRDYLMHSVESFGYIVGSGWHFQARACFVGCCLAQLRRRADV